MEIYFKKAVWVIKIAIITDVHGNASALEAALSEIDKRRDIEHIYCLGDMIAIGPDSNEVLHILFSRADVSMITGNHDEAVLALADADKHPETHPNVKAHHQWILERMDASYIEKLKQLPRTINKQLRGKEILFTHYHIETEKMSAPISKDPFSSLVEPSLENMEQLFVNHDESLICFGHHHPVHYFQGENSTYLNPGALGCNDRPTARYAIVSLNKNKIDVDLKETAYDNRRFLESYHRLGVPERDFILKVFHGGQF